ncbi:hypothetical protein [Massilia sp. CF038]|uniref:hypothetical protein n=1 Tax=Massilia sp. CF038 TaxID=1881045 RepID=UPI000910CF5D|nr:hypothetical protein [Massilia sp. CF038]SHG47996.1 hypothetical protein SAMN05428948_0659 [Massilia sp. CF038]
MNHNSGVINTGSVGGSISNVHHYMGAAVAATGQEAELQKLEAQLRQLLAAAHARDPEAAGAVKDNLDAVLHHVRAEQPNKSTIKISAEGLQKAASAVEGVLPVAMRIVAVLGTAFGFSAGA